MPEVAPNPELLRSLGRLVRGLSALFWGLPFTTVVCVQAAKTDFFHSYGISPPVLVTGWLVIGVWLLGAFQPQERIWQRALDRCLILALINFGLSPFIFWWKQSPGEPYGVVVVGVLALTGVLFLSSLNLVMLRLTAMLPDEHLRLETRQFTRLNRSLLMIVIFLGVVLGVILQNPQLVPPPYEIPVMLRETGLWVLIFMVLPPLAMTMAMLWKIKEVIMDSVFGGGTAGRIRH